MQRNLACFSLVFALWAALAWNVGLHPDGLIQFADPDWSYLLNALAMNTGEPPRQVDHPGLTVHWIAGGLLRLAHFLQYRELPLIDSVFLHPESYLNFIGLAFAGLTALSMAFFSVLLLSTEGVVAVLAFHLVLICSPEVILNLRRVNPEGVLLFLCPLFLSSLVAKPIPATKSLFPFALACALGLAAKVVFFPLVLFLLLWRWRQGAIGALLICVLFFLLFTPALSQWELTYNFFKLLLSSKGSYGNGEQGFMGLREAIMNLRGIWGRDHSAFLLFLPVFVAALFRSGPGRKVDLLACLVALLGFFMVAKHGTGEAIPGSRYLLPVTFVLAWRAALAAVKWRPILFYLPFVLCLQALKLAPLKESMARANEHFQERNQTLRENLAKYPSCGVLVDNSYWSRLRAFYGAFPYTQRQYEQDFNRIYPDTFFYEASLPHLRPIRGSYHLPQALVAGMMEEGRCFLVAGVPEAARMSASYFGKLPGEPLENDVFFYGTRKTKPIPGGPSKHSPSSSRASP